MTLFRVVRVMRHEVILNTKNFLNIFDCSFVGSFSTLAAVDAWVPSSNNSDLTTTSIQSR